MQQDEETSPGTTDRPQTTMWSWLMSPWLLLILGSVTALLLWVGCGVWIEYRRAAVLAELRASPGLDVRDLGDKRYPVWMPTWLGDQLQNIWDPRIVDVPLVVDVLEPLSERQLDLLVRQPSIYRMLFSDGSHVSDEALLTLCETQHFKMLEFGRPRQLTHKHYEALTHNPNLEALWKAEGPFDQTALNALERMRQLTDLELAGPLSDAVRVTGLGRLPHLRNLEWQDSQLTDEQVPDLAGFPSLSLLALHKTLLTRRSWAALGSMHIDQLDLESPHIDDHLADELSRNPNLRSFRLRGGQFTDRALRRFLEGGQRESVDTETGDLSLETAKLIGSVPWLRRLEIRGGPQIDDEILKAIAHEHLWTLSILNSSITDAGVEALLHHSELMTVGLANSRITDRSLKALNTLRRLNNLDLRNTAITDDGLRRYYLSTDFMFLHRLHLGGTQVSAAAVKEFQQQHPDLVVYGVDGIEADDRTKEWFRPLDATERP